MNKMIYKSALIGICSLISVSAFMAGAADVSASTGGKTAANAITWARSMVGKGVDHDGMYGNQCVDLVKAYYSYLGQKAVNGNGKDYVNNTLPSGWKRHKGVQPQKGDILIYTGGYGGYGHVAIYESDYSTYHQNWNSSSYVVRVTSKYTYSGDVKYWGVIRPDFAGSSSVLNSKTIESFTGVKKHDGIWTFFKNGKADYTYTGVARSTTGNWVFVRKGKFDNKYTGVAQSTTGNWVFVKDGRFYDKYTGVAQSTTGNWVFVKDGRFYDKYTGVAQSTTGNWVFVKNGRYNTGFTGVVKSTTGNTVYVKKGRYDPTYTGIASVWNSSKKYYVVKGRWKSDFTGKYKTYKIKNGVVI